MAEPPCASSHRTCGSRGPERGVKTPGGIPRRHRAGAGERRRTRQVRRVRPRPDERRFRGVEDGKPQTIERAEFEQLDRPPPLALPHIRPTEAPPHDSPAPIPRAEAAPSGPTFVIGVLCVFFDLSSMQPEEVTRVVAAARTYTGQLTPADLVAVVSLSTTWRMLQEFTADREQLDRVIGKLDPNGGLGFEEGSTGDADGTADNGAAFTADETEVNIFNTDRRLEALRTLADALGGIRAQVGRVFSSGTSQTGLEQCASGRAVIDHAVRANVAIMRPTRGLQAMVPGGEARWPASAATRRLPASRCRVSSTGWPARRTR